MDLSENEQQGCAGCLLVLVLILLLIFISWVRNFGGQEDIDGVVESTYVKRSGETDRFFVVLRDRDGVQHVLQNADTPWWWRFDSADAQAKLQQGKRVRVHVTGYRWYFMSWFPNIVRVEVLER